MTAEERSFLMRPFVGGKVEQDDSAFYDSLTDSEFINHYHTEITRAVRWVAGDPVLSSDYCYGLHTRALWGLFTWRQRLVFLRQLSMASFLKLVTHPRGHEVLRGFFCLEPRQ
jgi:hypothetical protein